MEHQEIINFINNNLRCKSNKFNAKCLNERWFSKNNYGDVYDEIMGYYPDLPLINKIKMIIDPKFCYCGKPTIRTYCSLTCANKSEDRKNNIIKGITDESHTKRRNTFLKNYGVLSNFHRKEIQDKIERKDYYPKIQKTLQDRYGVSSITDIPGVKERIEETIKNKFEGVKHSQQHFSDIFHLVDSQDWWNDRDNFCDAREFLIDYMTLSTIYKKAHKFRPDWSFSTNNISSQHKRVIDLVSHSYHCDINTRVVIAPNELDIYIPEFNLAIEVNGIYWHSEISGGKDRNYHLNKTVLCREKGISLLQFWDSEIDNKWPIVSSMIMNRTGLSSNKVSGRKCTIIEIKKEREKEFLNRNHLQGYVPSSLCYGLEYQGELVSLMSFGKARFNKKADCELLRFCNKLNTTVIGGASRLFKKRPEGIIISYADRRYSIR